MLNSPAFESRKRLPRMGLPRYSFIILQCFQTNSDTVWAIINHSQCSALAQLSSACSSLAYKTFKINSIMKLISVNYAVLEGEEEGKQFPETSEGFLLTLPPPASFGRRHFTLIVYLPQKWVVVSILRPKSEHSSVSDIPAATGGGTAHAPHKALQMVVFNCSQGFS